MQWLFIYFLVAVSFGVAAGTLPAMLVYLAKEFRQEHKDYRLQLQLLVAMHEMNQLIRSTTCVDRSLDGLRTLLRRIDTIEGMTLEEAEAAARRVERPRAEVMHVWDESS